MIERVSPIRAFIAIELAESVKRELSSLQRQLQVQPSEGIKWVAPEGIHLTLKFFGWVAPDRIEQIKSAIAKSIAGTGPFELRLSNLGAFPSMKRMNVVWCGLSGDLPKLNMLQQSIEKWVSLLGFPTESRAFSPHLTLARLRDEVTSEVKQKLALKITRTKVDPDLTIQVGSVSLMQSTLFPTGAVYTELARFPLS
ncbi:RNA 2',3'-cyclic phosphodiesterase [Dehalogenimonas etheniformans]|nr:RNA 2',3'-cyclic phosphodiesterase [Dehalogenimonas etheniformans]QNT75290.1 RNA 2',3'-cyclic phosphodiesterase [Dehalogenimonas etheniformans]